MQDLCPDAKYLRKTCTDHGMELVLETSARSGPPWADQYRPGHTRIQKEDYWRETAGLLVLVLLLVIGERFGRVVPLGIVRPWLDP
jgi:hypothetical protein